MMAVNGNIIGTKTFKAAVYEVYKDLKGSNFGVGFPMAEDKKEGAYISQMGIVDEAIEMIRRVQRLKMFLRAKHGGRHD